MSTTLENIFIPIGEYFEQGIYLPGGGGTYTLQGCRTHGSSCPSLPVGLTLDPETCVLSGTVNNNSIISSNNGIFCLTVHSSYTQPQGICAYYIFSYYYICADDGVLEIPIGEYFEQGIYLPGGGGFYTLQGCSTDGSPCPSLPVGLTLDPETCVLSGTVNSNSITSSNNGTFCLYTQWQDICATYTISYYYP